MPNQVDTIILAHLVRGKMGLPDAYRKRADGLINREFLFNLDGLKPGFQSLDLSVRCGCSPLQFAQPLRLGKLGFSLLLELRLQSLNFGVLCRRRLLQFAGSLGRSKLDRIALFLVCQLQSLAQLLVKLIVADLLQDVRIAGLVLRPPSGRQIPFAADLDAAGFRRILPMRHLLSPKIGSFGFSVSTILLPCF
jgi:hypothetical protein